MQFLSKIILSGLIGLVGFFGYHTPAQTPISFGSFNPTGGQTYRLQSSIGTTNTSVTLSSFKEPISNIKYTMTYLNSSIEYGTLDPQNNTSKEFISFTGITQNADNTATLTGVTRGLGFSYPYTASTTLAQPHSGQSIFILSNPPQLTNQYANLSNDNAFLAVNTFNSYLPTTSITATTSNQFVTKGYVDSGLLAGAATSTESVTGIVRLATRLQQASSTLTTVNTPLVLQAQYATSSFNGNNATGLNVVVTRNNNTIDPNAIATSSLDIYNWGGQVNFNASTTLNSTTTIAATSANRVSFNGVSYNFPSSRGSSGSSLVENGSGTLTWGSAIQRYTYVNTAGSLSASSGSYATTTMITVPANTLTASSTIELTGAATCVSGATGFIALRDSTGVTLAQLTCATAGTGNAHSNFKFTVTGNNSVTSQTGVTTGEMINTQTSATCGGGACSFVQDAEDFRTSSINLANATTFTLVARGITASTNMSYWSFIVNP